MTERIPHIYSYTSAVNTGRPVHPMCAAMALPPAAGESAPISPEVPQAHWLTTPATPSAAVGSDGPGAGDTVPRAEYDRVVKLMNHFRDVIAEYHDMATSDSKPTNVHNPESEDTPPHKPVMGPVVGTATVKHHEPEPSTPAESVTAVASTADRLRSFSEQLESGEPIKATRIERHDTPDGPMHVRTQTEIQPAESPDDWVTQDRVPARVALDEYRVSGSQSEPGVWKRCIYGTFPIVNGYQHGRPLVTATGNATLELRCRRKDLPVVPDETPALKPPCSPVCALCGNLATCFVQYADHDKGFACDSCCGHGNEDGWCMPVVAVEPTSLPSPWRPMSEKPTAGWFWLAWESGDMYVYHWLDEDIPRRALAWMPVEKPQHPNAAPPDKPRMRKVAIMEFRWFQFNQDQGLRWGQEIPTTSDTDHYIETGRMAVVEVPE